METEPHDTTRSFDEDYYRRTYRDYVRQNPPSKLAFYLKTIRQSAPPRLPLSVLDVGCGLGAFAGFMRSGDPHNVTWSITATDVSEFAITWNRANHPGVKFETLSVGQTLLLQKRFDVITAFDVLEHIEDLDSVLPALKRSLQPDGVLVVVVPVYDGPLGPLVRIADRDPTHVQIRSRSWWLRRLHEYFSITAFKGIFRGLSPWGYYFHRPTRRLRSIAPAIIVVCRPLPE